MHVNKIKSQLENPFVILIIHHHIYLFIIFLSLFLTKNVQR